MILMVVNRKIIYNEEKKKGTLRIISSQDLELCLGVVSLDRVSGSDRELIVTPFLQVKKDGISLAQQNKAIELRQLPLNIGAWG